MFNLLRNKISDFISGIAKKSEAEEKSGEEQKKTEQKPSEPKEAELKKQLSFEPSSTPEQVLHKPQAIQPSQPAPHAPQAIQPSPVLHKPQEIPPSSTTHAPVPSAKAQPPAPSPSPTEIPQHRREVVKEVSEVKIAKPPEQIAHKPKEEMHLTREIAQTRVEIPVVREQAPVLKKEEKEIQKAVPPAPKEIPKIVQPVAPIQKEKPKGIVESISQFIQIPKPAAAEPKEKKLEVNLSLESRVKSIFSPEIEIKEKDVDDLLEQLNMSLLESDVAYEVAEAMTGAIRRNLVGKRVQKKALNSEVKGAIKSALLEILASDRQFDLIERARSVGKPAKILFVGPNGAGKTTTMAKVAHLFMRNGMQVVFSASDTFRAAAIEQTEEHGRRLGIKTIKSAYGADPASVAFDSVSYAKAHNIDAVLIDSAGRQETNANLIGELKKINRVVKPDLKVYIGESIAGNAILEQVKSFDEAIGLDGVILTKLDCDAKGGTALSIAKATSIPIIYIGIGQAYEDLKAFDANEIADEILAG